MTYYIVIALSAVLVIAVARHALRLRKAGKLMKLVEQAALSVRVATFSRLSNRYGPDYGDKAQALATAVTNELFSDPYEEGYPATQFAAAHPDIVEKELLALRSDQELLSIIYATLQEEIGIRHAYGASPATINDTFEKLRRRGLLAAEEPISTDEFLERAHTFFRTNTKN